MKEYNEIGTEEMLEWAKMNGMNLSEGQAKELVSEQKNDIDMDEWFKANGINPIGEYDNLAKRMKDKLKTIMDSLKDNEHELDEQDDDRDSTDTLDEKDGKEELDADKKKEVEENKKEKNKKGDVVEETDEDNKKEDPEEEKEKSDQEGQEQTETPKKDEYLAMVKKLHEMRIVDYKDQMKKDDPRKDKYFKTMIYLQRDVNRQRAAFIKEYGAEELTQLENQYLKEELKYEKTLNIRMERDLSKLRELDEKLDAILDRMQVLQKSLEDGNIDLEEYNDEINGLEKDKLDTLWAINRLNPELLEEKQENINDRDKFERLQSPVNIQKNKAMTAENKAKMQKMAYDEKKQDGMAEKINDSMKDAITTDIDEKEKRLDELRNELQGIDIKSADGKKRALEIIGEIQTLESQKAAQEEQYENLEKNMGAGVQSYGDLEAAEVERQSDTEEFTEAYEEIDPADVSDDLMTQLRNQALEDPSTPEQAEEYLDGLEEATEEIAESKEKDGPEDDDNAPSLFNRRKRPY